MTAASPAEPPCGPPREQDGNPAGEPEPDAMLADLPSELWQDLARAFRRAIEPVEDGDLPPSVRPFRGWKPDRLLRDRPRLAIARALTDDARLRERLGEVLADNAERARLAELSANQLVRELGEPRAVSVLVATAQWDAIATVGAQVADRAAARQRSAAERADENAAERLTAERDRLERDLATVRGERDEARLALGQAEGTARALVAERDRLAGELARLTEEVGRLEAALKAERTHYRDRLERTRRRAEEAEGRARVDGQRAREVADELEGLAKDLRAAVDPDRHASPARGPDRIESMPAPVGKDVPRTVRPATPGRPCKLPAGLTADKPDGVRALLAVPGMTLIVDGYNVTKDPHAPTGSRLPEQRRWVIALCGGLVARYSVRPVIVFDTADERREPMPSPRGVIVDFAVDAETADDRIVEAVDALAADVPVMVVTSDRELGRRVEGLHADVVPASAFIAAVAG